MKLRSLKFFIGLAVLTFALSSFAANKIKLGLNWKAEPEFGGFYAAKALGFYDKIGLDVEIMEGAAGVPIAQMVASGQADFGVTSGDHIILSRANGADLKALFTVYQKSPQCIIVREESPIKSIKDLMASDFTLAAGAGSPWLTYLQKKYAPKSLKVVPYQGGVSAYLNDKKLAQQGFAGSEPQLAEEKGVKTRTLLIADDGFDNYAALLFTSGKLIKKDPAIVELFVEATRMGWNAYVQDPSVANKKIAELNPSMPEATAKIILDIQKPLMVGDGSKPFGTLEPARWQTLVNQMKDIGLIKKPILAKDLMWEVPKLTKGAKH